jgi:PAS domain S-box-containing protein
MEMVSPYFVALAGVSVLSITVSAMITYRHREPSVNTFSLVRNSKGEPAEILGVGRDITERKHMEEVRAASLYVRNLIEASLDPLVTIRPDGRITYVNKATELVTGFSRDQLIGSDFSDYFTDPEKARRGYEEVFEKGFVKDYGLAIRDKSGKVTDVLYNATVYRDERGEVQGVFAAARDITERKRMEARLAQSQRLAAIGSTAAMVGHDLRNPLQALAGMVYLLKKHYEGIPVEYKKTAKFDVTETLHMMEKSLGYMNKIISDLQNYAAPLQPELLDVSTGQLLKESLSTIAIPPHVKVSVTVDKGAETLSADPDLVKRVFMNLAMNAVQAMPQGGELKITAHKNDEEELISFQDTGVGISREALPKLFEPLFTTKAQGQGLGLAVCKRVMEAHGGTITVDSRVGKGSTFTAMLPIPRNMEKKPLPTQ